MSNACVTNRGGWLRLLTCAGAACAISLPMAAGRPRAAAGATALPQASPGQLIISEFRLSGPGGDEDEFVEILNVSGSEHTVAASDESEGYAVATSQRYDVRDPERDGDRRMAGTTLVSTPAVYSLSSYPAGDATATADMTYTTDIPVNTGLALFNTAEPHELHAGQPPRCRRLRRRAQRPLQGRDAVTRPLRRGASSTSLVRRLPGGCIGSAPAPSGNCESIQAIRNTADPSNSRQQDTDSNAADFIFVDTAASGVGFGRRLGAPGPQNLASPTGGFNGLLGAGQARPVRTAGFRSEPRPLGQHAGIPAHLLQLHGGCHDPSAVPDRGPDDAPVHPGCGGSASANVEPTWCVTVDRPPCGSGTSGVTVRGTTLETPPAQADGGGYNSSLSVGHDYPCRSPVATAEPSMCAS